MEITYNLILKYLCESKEEDNSFSNKKNIIQNSETFSSFSELFSSSYYRYGITIYNSKKENISFLCSLLFSIDKNIISKDLNEIEDTINLLKINIQLKKNKDFIQNVSDNLNINLIIFNFDSNKITTVYPDLFFNPWLPTVYLAKFEDFWEPIVSNKNKIFNLSNDIDSILRYNILLENIEYFNDEKEFTINDNFEDILKNEKLYVNNNINTEVVFTNETFISENIIKNDITVKKLNKMKKEDLKELLNELKLICNIKKPKKSDYINLISNSLNL